MIERLHPLFLKLPWVAALIALTALAIGLLGPDRRRASAVIAAGLVLLLALHALIFLHTATRCMLFPYEQKSVVEGDTVYNAFCLLNGETSYRDPVEAPFRSMVYPPLHEMVLAGVMAALGGPSLIGARVVSLLSVIAASALAGWCVWRRTRRMLFSVAAGMFLPCGYGLTLQWMEQARNDALMVLLITLGLALAERSAERKRFPWAALVALVAALYTKQTAAFAALAVVLYLALARPRWALLWAGAYAALAALLFALMQLWTQGWFAFYTLRVPARVGLESDQWGHAATFALVVAPALIGAIALIVTQRRDMRSAGPAALWGLAFLIGLPVCVLQSFKWGATMNAFLPLLPILGVLNALLLHRLLPDDAAPARRGLIVGALALVQIGFLHYRPALPGPEHAVAHLRIEQWVRAAPGDVLVSGFTSQTYRNGKAFFGDPVIMGDVERAGLWRGNAVIRKIRDGGFALLILRPKIEPSDLADAVRLRYVPVERIRMRTDLGGWPYVQVYVPADAPWHPAAP